MREEENQTLGSKNMGAWQGKGQEGAQSTKYNSTSRQGTGGWILEVGLEPQISSCLALKNFQEKIREKAALASGGVGTSWSHQ